MSIRNTNQHVDPKKYSDGWDRIWGKNVPHTLGDFVKMLDDAPVEWVEKNIHPYVEREPKDTDSSYLRRMALWAYATNTFFKA